jgi:murein DD-endopeptidase MepM/ murein hydrolase activator NlpD
MPLTRLRILTDRLTGKERRISLRALVALSSLPLFGGVAAFGLAPDTRTLGVPTQTLIQDIELPRIADSDNARQTLHREARVQPGDTLAGALARLGIEALDVQNFLDSDAADAAARALRAGQRLEVLTDAEGRLLELHLNAAQGPELRVLRQGERFVASAADDGLETRIVLRSGRINSSLFAATDAAGIPESIADRIADMFSTHIDFRQDLRRGDTFSVIYTVNYRHGEPVGPGKLLAAEFVNAGKAYRAVLFRDPFGQEAFYTPEGESLKKGFLRSPLEFTRVTSSFSSSRLHPLYGFHRAHTGVDFGAATGTRVKAVGDAVVEFAGRRGGYGNLVILRHNNGYETYYAHLNGFAPGIRPGRAVEQGTVVGFVGATGAATGPHLHYEIRIAGKPYNPVSVKLPTAMPLAASLKPAFLQQTAAWRQRLALLHGTNTAALD